MRSKFAHSVACVGAMMLKRNMGEPVRTEQASLATEDSHMLRKKSS